MLHRQFGAVQPRALAETAPHDEAPADRHLVAKGVGASSRRHAAARAR